MTDEPNNEDKPFNESDLSSSEYRERLTRKLNCLIALLEVAMARVRRSLASPNPDVERLTKIRQNLKSTLDVCLRARTALERHEPLPDDLPASLTQVAKQGPAAKQPLRSRAKSLPVGADCELSSIEEKRKFQRMGKITPQELNSLDMDDLERKLKGL